jgi:hypothetical protein
VDETPSGRNAASSELASIQVNGPSGAPGAWHATRKLTPRASIRFAAGVATSQT